MSKSTQDNGIPCPAERERIRERAQLILAQARLLREHLDRTGDAFALSLQDHDLAGGPEISCSIPNSRLQVS